MSIDTLLNSLDGVRENGRGRWMARCPAHDDKTPSLSIRETNDGTILLHCFAGCGAADVLAAVDMTLADLFPDGAVAHHRPARKRQRIPARQMLIAVSQALTTIKLVDAKACDFIPMNDEERDAVDRALAVLAENEREVCNG